MKQTPLTQGKVALVDDEDFDRLSRYKWCAKKDGNNYYALRMTPAGMVSMHQEIIGKKLGYIIDHRDGDGLNNCRHNLRHVTRRQNAQNMHVPKSSKYPGIYWHKTKRRWVARAKVRGRYQHFGNFVNEFDAFSAYRERVKELTGETVLCDRISS